MEILISDILEEGLQIEAGKADNWFSSLVRELTEDKSASLEGACANLFIVRFEDNVTIDGDVRYRSRNICDRCLEDYEELVDVHIHVVLIPQSGGHSNADEEVELAAEDLEFGFYEGDRIDLSEVVGDQVVLAQPMKHICQEGCKGLCQQCGKNLNEGECGCKDLQADPRWSALKDFKGSSGDKN